MKRKRRPNAPPEHPYLLSETGFEPLTPHHSPFWHFEWIKTNASILKNAFDEIVETVERIKSVPLRPPNTGRGLWKLLGLEYFAQENHLMTVDAAALHEYHQLRIVLQREVEWYLPELRIPVLRDSKRGWLFPGPLPDHDQFMQEMDDIYHEANLRQVKVPEGGIAMPYSTPTPNNPTAGKLKKGRPTLTRKQIQDYKRWTKAWSTRPRGEKKQAYCNRAGITVKQLNAALQNTRRKH
jgi:hypothetical protein